MQIAAVLIAAFLVAVEAIDLNQFYPFNKLTDDHVTRGLSTVSSKILLSTPIKFYDKIQNAIWVHTDGFVSFDGVQTKGDFPFFEPLIAPYMSSLDTSEQGHVTYRETNDAQVLNRASNDVRGAFATSQASFNATSVFIVTWKNVCGRSAGGEPALFTFQLVIISDQSKSFALFLYPKHAMASVADNVLPTDSNFEARAGFNFGHKKYLEMYPVENLVDYENMDRKGEWIFQIGGDGVIDRDDVIDPDRRRLVRREALINVQEVDLSDSLYDSSGDSSSDFDYKSRFYDYCGRDTSLCRVNNSMCVNYQHGHCCQCEPGYVGNGHICASPYQNLEIKGVMNGTIDIHRADGSVNRVKLTNSQFQGFSMLSLLRAHSAISNVPRELASILNKLIPIGEISAWLFATPSGNAVNGFDFTGGRFQRQLKIRFHDSKYRFDLRQLFKGASFQDDEAVIDVTGVFVGMLPEILFEEDSNQDDIEVTFVRESPGRITMKTTNSFSSNGTRYVYDVSEEIFFSECPQSRQDVPDRLKLRLSTIFSQIDSDVRWAADATVSVDDLCSGTNPCGVGTCYVSSSSHRCRCPEGYEEAFDDEGRSYCAERQSTLSIPTCDIDGICGPGTCVPDGNGFYCLCPPTHYEIKGVNDGSCQEKQQTDVLCENNLCGVGTCISLQYGYTCECPAGFIVSQRSSGDAECVEDDYVYPDLDPCEEHECGVGRCVDNDYDYQCVCPDGYVRARNNEGKEICQAQRLPHLQQPCEVAGICGKVGECKVFEDSYRCDCPDGYIEVEATYGSRCEEASIPELGDPCSIPDICENKGTCIKTSSSYRCQCFEGYTEVFDVYGSRCEDIDECSQQNICSPYAACNNYDGSYQCDCEPGFTGDGRNCRKDSGCETRRQLALKMTRVDDVYVPDCTDEGLYAKVQCESKGRICWCVDEDTGDVIEGTRSDGGPNDVNCQPYSGETVLTECQRQYREVEEQIRIDPSIREINFPDCTQDGLFFKRQCQGNINLCWCVIPETGERIPGTSSQPGEGHLLDCDASATNLPYTFEIPECERQYRELVARKQSNPSLQDLEYPECDEDGLFTKRQCSGFGSTCWCVDPYSGVELPRTRTQPGLSLNCEDTAEEMTECQRQRHLFAKSKSFDELPVCTEDGLFERHQCDVTINLCRCVDPYTGDTIEGTETYDGATLICDQDIGECLRKYLKAKEELRLQHSTDSPVNFVDCDVNGNFKRRQCREDDCKCVDPITGAPTGKTGSKDRLDCDFVSICDQSNPCGVGRCLSSDDGYRCDCPRGFSEVRLNEEITCERDRSTSVNGFYGCDDPAACGEVGECVEMQNANHRCRCPDKYIEVATDRGSICERSTQCEGDNLCGNVGECVPQRNTFRCRCPNGYEEFFVDGHGDCRVVGRSGCENHNCGRHSRCEEQGDSYTCVCLDGYKKTDSGRCKKDTASDCLQASRRQDDANGYTVKCTSDGYYEKLQCNRVTRTCWCVDHVTGHMVEGSMSQPGYGQFVDCEAISAPSELTDCQAERWSADRQYSGRSSTEQSYFVPACTSAGAYEPVQYHEDQDYYSCVDFNGLEISRHQRRPDCLTACQLESYYAETDNIFTRSSRFVPQCDGKGDYKAVQCQDEFCYCVDSRGREIPESRARLSRDQIRCHGSERYEEPTPPIDIIFAQASGLQAINFPIEQETQSRRLLQRVGHATLVGVDFDCSSYQVFYSDVRSRAIYRVPLNDLRSQQTIVRRKLRSPEGVAVDYISGNLYWVDSGTDRIEVSRLDGTMRTVLVTRGLVNPRGIAVDPVRGKLYWSDWNRKKPRIMSANMDGSNVTVFVKTGLQLPNDVKIDIYSGRLCFIDAGTKFIECMNSDGRDRRVIVDLSRRSNIRSPFGLEVSGSYIYFTDRKLLYQVHTRTGEEKVVSGPLGVHGQMFGVTLSFAECPRKSNYCFINNGGCSHLCLPVPNGRVCKCPPGSASCV